MSPCLAGRASTRRAATLARLEEITAARQEKQVECRSPRPFNLKLGKRRYVSGVGQGGEGGTTRAGRDADVLKLAQGSKPEEDG